MSDAYSCVAGGKLKLKKDDSLIKKKKKKSKDKNKEKQKAQKTLNESNEELQRLATKSGLTKAEIAFKKQQEKMRNKRIMEMASTTHKQRVEKFNEHLDSLTEHFDIPKVSWTK